MIKYLYVYLWYQA